MKTPWFSAALLLPALLPVMAQQATPLKPEVSMGHLHVYTRDIDVQKKFWVEVMGATATKLGQMDVMKFPDVLVMLRKGEPTGGTKGSVVNHMGFRVKDIESAIPRMKAAGADIVTRTEISGGRATGDIYRNEASNQVQAFVMGPDELKIEIIEDKSLAVPIAHHHVHFFIPAPIEGVAWYVKHFGAKGGKRGPFDAADLPGVNLSFTNFAETVAASKGRSLDHIGFEIRGLEAFCKKLEAAGVKFDVPYRKVPAAGLAVAFFTDPWGTYVELTEGLDQFQYALPAR
jgi:catechol 2,3-dioxygenase-like lactoylglutathione lyase family enzyme